ncbi:nicotinate mononucleotide-dependent phosphoribosyltransferase CobT [Candidatus Chlorohelix sp.]|uniref:nicotinate mononucleotide-dependent phosphoribosyltransferase CobT n=1 Tax=Candidatus Chlorohelix sp. TaxID=3139201 RepID=UPI00305E7898
MVNINKKLIGVYHLENIKDFLISINSLTPYFSLVAAYTATVQIPGVSGAGTTSELRELTATADVEILALGKAVCLHEGVPSNPSGAPGPSIITHASFKLMPEMPYLPVDAGLKIIPAVKSIVKLEGSIQAKTVSSGRALESEAQATKLFYSGWKLGAKIGSECANKGRYLIIAETVPGGTTTALGLLLALGINAEDRVSSSMPGNAHHLKLEAVKKGFQALGKEKGAFANTPLAGVAALGDTMQPATAGMALGASIHCPVMLGGGTQMAAVVALAAALVKNGQVERNRIKPENIALVTTRWVSNDLTADLAGLGAEIEAKLGTFPVCYMSANLDFSQSKYPGMRQYELGFVKEGVGAGAAALAAMLTKNLEPDELLPYIEHSYEQLCL